MIPPHIILFRICCQRRCLRNFFSIRLTRRSDHSQEIVKVRGDLLLQFQQAIDQDFRFLILHRLGLMWAVAPCREVIVVLANLLFELLDAICFKNSFYAHTL
jgi:hypothetical protein